MSNCTRLAIYLCVIAVCFSPTESFSQTLGLSDRSGKELRKSSKTKISSTLHRLVAANQQKRKAPINALVSQEELKMGQVTESFLMSGNEVGLKIRATDWEILAPELKKVGYSISAYNEKYNIIEGTMDVNNVLLLDNLSPYGLLSVDVIYRPIRQIGLITSQADSVMETDKVRNLNSIYDGTGVKIGILSDSYDNNIGAATDISSGDLPGVGNPYGNNTPITVIEDLGSEGIDEGRAMLQLIHDMVPRADLYFATAFTGEQGFADNIQALADADCKVIVDDVIYFAEPFFQDGIIAQKVDEVSVDEDVIYLSSAGNSADKSYEILAPQTVMPAKFGIANIDFDTSMSQDTFKQVTLNAGERMRLALQWDDPFYTVNGVDTDLDIAVYDNMGTVVAAGADDNITSQSPFEFVDFTNLTGSVATYNILMVVFSGPTPNRIKFINYGSEFVAEEYDTNSSTIVGHAAAEKALAVAAVPFFSEIPESFTSHGPTTVLFNADGTVKASTDVRQTPNIAATDGTNTTFFGIDIVEDNDAFPNFFGTSAAAPHAAAIAALIRQAHPTFDRGQIFDILYHNAKDIGAPGFDNITGNGFISALSSCILPSIDTPVDFLSIDAIARRIRVQDEISASGQISSMDSYEFISEVGTTLDIDFDIALGASLSIDNKACDNNP